MQQLLRDVRFAFRTLSRSPAYTLIALLTLGIGIGASTAVFSIVNGILLAPLPYPESDRLVRVSEVNRKSWEMNVAWRNLLDYREARTFETLVAHGWGSSSTVLGTGQPLRVPVTEVSQGFFRTIGIHPSLGRPFTPDEHRPGADPAVVVSHGFWRAQLGGEPELAGRRLTVDGFDVRIVGVMPPGFDYPAGTDIWRPLELSPQSESRTAHNWAALGRLRSGAGTDHAEAELTAIVEENLRSELGGVEEAEISDFHAVAVSVTPLHEATVGATRRSLLILLGASALLLLVACTNLASTTLARGTARSREYAVRQALGIGRGGIVRQLFTESLVLSLTGATLGLGCAALVIRLLPVLAPAGIPRVAEVGLDLRVVAFAVGIAVLTAALFGLLPALRLTERGLANPLRSGTRADGGPSGKRVWRWLIAGEMAVALLLLVGSGLLLRSFWRTLEVDPGFRTEGVLTATVNPPSSRYGEPDAKRAYWDAVLRELSAIPAVAEVGLVSGAPMGWVANGQVEVRGGPADRVNGEYQLVSPGYLQAMGIPLLRGRFFDPSDVPTGEQVVVVNQAFARLAWPDQDPIGKRMTSGGMDDMGDHWATVIGVVGNVRQSDLTRPAEPTYYFYYRQRPLRAWSMTAVLRPAHGDPTGLTAPVRERVASVDSDVPVTFATIRERVSRTLAARRFTMLVLGVFAAAALVLAFIGVYGVVSYAVERRTREIGIRVALGARPAAVRRLVQREYMGAAALGAAVGILLALGLTRVLESLLFEVEPTDPTTFAAVVLLLAAAAWLASLIPALRTSRVDPMETMRAE